MRARARLAIRAKNSERNATTTVSAASAKYIALFVVELKLEQGSLFEVLPDPDDQDSFIPTLPSWSVKANIISRISLVLFALSFIHLSHKNIQTCVVNMHFFGSQPRTATFLILINHTCVVINDSAVSTPTVRCVHLKISEKPVIFYQSSLNERQLFCTEGF